MYKSFEVILSNGEYERYRADDRYEYEGYVHGTLGGWSDTNNKPIEPKMYERPYTEFLFDPTRADPHTKSEVTKKTIRFIFEKFQP